MKFFITSTDTHVGKTYIGMGLLKTFNRLQFSTMALKPIASGGILKDGVIYNEDALSLQQCASVKLNYSEINPFCFHDSIAPHIAAMNEKVPLSLAMLNSQLQSTFRHSADVVVIEGVGGWMVPLNASETMADFVRYWKFPVILVAGLRLGCLNHTLLTYRTLLEDHIRLIGWIANCIDPNMQAINDNIQALVERIKAPLLGVVQYQEKPEEIIDTFKILQHFSRD